MDISDKTSSGKNEALIFFVKETLGCMCPDEVFQDIKERGYFDNDLKLPYLRFIFGGKLLLYIWVTEDQDSLKKNIQNVLDSGVEERNKKKLNRFRLAVLSDTAVLMKDQLMMYVENHMKDDRMHLHILPEESLII